MTARADIRIMRAYDEDAAPGGARILVDRVWPRGMTKEQLGLDDWIKEVAPSTALRKWFGHDPAKWEEFRRRYRAELDGNHEALAKCREWCRKGPVTLLYGAKDRTHNQAVVLAEYLREHPDARSGAS